MIISNHQDFNHADSFGDKEPLVHDDFQGLSHDKTTASFDTGKQSLYVDEDFNHFPSSPEEYPLVHNAADVGRSANYRDLGKRSA
jgi:hypothetical protein